MLPNIPSGIPHTKLFDNDYTPSVHTGDNAQLTVEK